MRENYTPEYVELLTAIGELAVIWSSLEFVLDGMVLLIHRGMDGAKFEPELPRSLSRKIGYLRSAFRRLGIPDGDLPRYEKFLDDVAVESVARHDIIHGFTVHHPHSAKENELIRLLINKTGWEQKRITITVETVQAASLTAHKLAEKAGGWLDFMLTGYKAYLEQAKQDGGQG